ncbi:MAG TPA: hypothetical protein VIR26_07720 [Metalysinibacillus sp.]
MKFEKRKILIEKAKEYNKLISDNFPMVSQGNSRGEGEATIEWEHGVMHESVLEHSSGLNDMGGTYNSHVAQAIANARLMIKSGMRLKYGILLETVPLLEKMEEIPEPDVITEGQVLLNGSTQYVVDKVYTGGKYRLAHLISDSCKRYNVIFDGLKAVNHEGSFEINIIDDTSCTYADKYNKKVYKAGAKAILHNAIDVNSHYYCRNVYTHAIKFYINKYKGVTVCLRIDERGAIVGKGIARLSKGDKYIKSVGKAIALSRAINKKEYLEFLIEEGKSYPFKK